MARVMEIVTPLGADVLLFHRMNAREEMGRLFEYELDLLSKKGDINLDDILAKSVTVKLEIPDGKTRYFNGYVTRFGLVGMHGRYHLYRATVRPWLWFLTRVQNSRIFQDMTVPEIIKKVFDDHSIAVAKQDGLSGTYPKRVYCVQYRETDFNFVSRLMEDEGIYYYFKHEQGKHTLMLSDSNGAHEKFPGYAKIPFVPLDRTSRIEQEYIHEWTLTREVEPGKFALKDFDFEKPSTSLLVKTNLQRKHDLADYEIYDYPGGYTLSKDGDQYVRTRMEEAQYQFELASGRCNARGLCVGYLFELTGQSRTDQNREYLVLSADYELEYTEYEAMENQGAKYACGFSVLNSKQAFRPRCTTRKPFVQGPQTAIVVGPSGDEIYTDKYGRVKVQFHWDRYGNQDENSSCWIRVSHPWAGKNWGMVAIPRIGQEVVVDFLEGDPDRPLITGRVYNAEQMPPWELPANKTQTGVLTRSSKGGAAANANAIRFEDKKGEEQLWIHAEKNQDIEVENDETHWVGHDRTKTIDHDETTQVKHDRTETVGNNETITIGVDRTEMVGSNETITIGVNRTESVGANETISIGANRTETVGANQSVTIGATDTLTVATQRTHTVGANETITVGAAQEITVGAARAVTVGAAQQVSIGADQGIDVGGSQSESIGKNYSLTVGEGLTESVGKDQSTSVGKNLSITAGDSITITTGSASISMKKDGTIVIKGKDITINGSGKINVKASSDVVVKGSKIGLN
jgi:type VI secretion system secreted protein VgrG